MATIGSRKVKDLIDNQTHEPVYIKGHAQATFMSDGATVEDAINSLLVSGIGDDLSESSSIAPIPNTVVKRDDAGQVHANAMVDENSMIWVTPTSSIDVIESADCVFQEQITDIETIRSGAAKGATAVQPTTLATVATSGSYNDLTNKPTIPDVSNKVDKVSGKGLSTNDYTTAEKNKLAGIATGAEVNVQSDWSVTDTASDAYIKNKPTIPAAITETNVSNWGFTKNSGTITSVKANGTSVATSGEANIPAASTSAYGVTKLSSSTSSTSTTLAATASAVKSAYDLANGKQDKLTSGTNIKTINGQSILGSGNITIEGGGNADANVGAVDTNVVIDDVNIEYCTRAYVDTLVGDINSVLESIINGGLINISVAVSGVTDLSIEQVRKIVQYVNNIYGDEYVGPVTNFKYTFNNIKLSTINYQRWSVEAGEAYAIQAFTNNDEGELFIQ